MAHQANSLLKKFLILLFVSTQGQLLLNAQEADTSRDASASDAPELFLLFGGGYSYSSGRDASVSPLVYRGHSGVVTAGFYDYRAKGHHKVDIHAAAGMGKPELAHVMHSKMWLYHMQVDYTYVHALYPIPELQTMLYLGGTWHTNAFIKYHTKYSNNFINYDGATDLAITPMARTRINLFQRQWHLDFRLVIPLVAAYIRPGFANSFPTEILTTDNNFKGFLKSIAIAGWGNYQRLQTQLALNYFLKNGNSLMLSYRWDYYHINSVNEVKQAFHTIAITTNFNLN